MNWLTQKQVKQAATKKAAIECSRLHWHQMATCTLSELNSKLRQLKYYFDLLREDYCALCLRYAFKDSCGVCPIGNDCKATNWVKAKRALIVFNRLPTQASLDTFQVEAKIMQATIAKLQEVAK